MKKMILIVALASSSCMSMQTRKGIAAEQIQMHPELETLNTKIQVLENRLDAMEQVSKKLDDLFLKLNTMEEAHRDDTDTVMSYLSKQIDEIKVLVKK